MSLSHHALKFCELFNLHEIYSIFAQYQLKFSMISGQDLHNPR